MRKKLTSAARCAIKMRSKDSDQKRAVQLLQHDLRNGPFHCFGYHQKCSPDYCRVAKKQRESVVSESTPANRNPNTNPITPSLDPGANDRQSNPTEPNSGSPNPTSSNFMTDINPDNTSSNTMTQNPHSVLHSSSSTSNDASRVEDLPGKTYFHF